MVDTLSALPTLTVRQPPAWLTRGNDAAERLLTARTLRHVIDPDHPTDPVGTTLRARGAIQHPETGTWEIPHHLERRLARMGGDDRRNTVLRLSVLRIDEQLAGNSLNNRDQAHLHSARAALCDLSFELNRGLAGAAIRTLRDRDSELGEELEREANAEVASRWMSWEPWRSALSTWVEQALRGAAQRVLRDKASLRSMSERAVARRQEVLTLAEQLRQNGTPVTVDSLHEASKATIEQVRTVRAHLTETGSLDLAALARHTTIGGDLLRRTATAAHEADTATCDEQVRDRTGISSYRIDQILNAAIHVSIDKPVGDEEGSASLADVLPQDHEADGLSEAELQQAEQRLSEHAHELSEPQKWLAIGRYGLLGAPAERTPSLAAELGQGRGRVKVPEDAARAATRRWLEADTSLAAAYGDVNAALTGILDD